MLPQYVLLTNALAPFPEQRSTINPSWNFGNRAVDRIAEDLLVLVITSVEESWSVHVLHLLKWICHNFYCNKKQLPKTVVVITLGHKGVALVFEVFDDLWKGHER